MMQSSDRSQISTIAGPNIVMDYFNFGSHGKSFLKFSTQFESTVFTKTSFSSSCSCQIKKLAADSDTTHNLQQIWLLEHLLFITTSREMNLFQ